MPPMLKQFQAKLKADGIKPWQLPKAPFKAPAYKMVVDSAVKAGVPVSESLLKNPESLCETFAGWFDGPAMASNTNGSAVVYGGGMNFYFASASDPSHPTVLPMGDVMMRVYFRGNIALVLGYFYSYEFDVTDPTSPAFLGYDYGMSSVTQSPRHDGRRPVHRGRVAAAMTSSSSTAGSTMSRTFNLETLYGPGYPWTRFLP